jgi:hypothetical protein
MASKAIVSGVSKIDPPLEIPATPFVARQKSNLAVHFEDGQVAHLDPANPSSGGLAEVFDELRRMNIPAYVEVDPASNLVQRVLIPMVGTVSNVTVAPSGDAEVGIEISHGQHVLKRSHPDYAGLLALLQSAKSDGSTVVVTEDDAHEVVDVRPSPHPRMPAAPMAAPPAKPPPHAAAAGPVTPGRATELFGQMAGQTCEPKTVPPPCIPFLYPDDGCWGRAHQMCRLMITGGAQPNKIWIYGNLLVKTRNNPNCSVRWGWHVAPTLQVAVSGHTETWVVDPSLFTKPVPEATWAGVQGDPKATTAHTDASAFYRSPQGQIETDPTYSKTAQVLATYRLRLKLRSLGSDGPPPYAKCAAVPVA